MIVIVIVYIIEVGNLFFLCLSVCLPITCVIIVWPLKCCSNHFLTFIRTVLDWIKLTFRYTLVCSFHFVAQNCCNSGNSQHHHQFYFSFLLFRHLFLLLLLLCRCCYYACQKFRFRFFFLALKIDDYIV